MQFTILNRYGNYPPGSKAEVFLTWDDWNDYSFFTLFGIFYLNEKSEKIDLGSIKIGYFGQKESDRVLSIGANFTEIDDPFFSVGADSDYYENLNQLGEIVRDEILKGLHDIAKDSDLFNRAILEDVTKVSFLRNISETSITGQYRRLATGGSRLTSYHFKFVAPRINDEIPPMELTFDVEPNASPPTNIHINNMIDSLTKSPEEIKVLGKFMPIGDDQTRLFANLVCVTFSAFDEFDHPPEERDKSIGLQYSYIGLKEIQDIQHINEPKSLTLLADEFVKSLISCRNNFRINRWKNAIAILESDPIFRATNISTLIDNPIDREIKAASSELFRRLSSGHKIVLLTLTRLVETVQERSLVLFDEPESHLHPPLLSSFIRAVSDLLINRNGVGIIATHSPVILQEVPRACVWKLRRNGAEAIAERLEIEAFGENVGVLTQEVFGLEVTDSGFHKIIKDLVRTTASYEMAIELLNNQIGLEGKAILRSLFYHKANSNENNT
jgi:AAA domain, putative AbiEii toxin, Type IV TA system